jgi:hypothetical protein
MVGRLKDSLPFRLLLDSQSRLTNSLNGSTNLLCWFLFRFDRRRDKLPECNRLAPRSISILQSTIVNLSQPIND